MLGLTVSLDDISKTARKYSTQLRSASPSSISQSTGHVCKRIVDMLQGDKLIKVEYSKHRRAGSRGRAR